MLAPRGRYLIGSHRVVGQRDTGTTLAINGRVPERLMSSADAYPLSAIAAWWNRVTGRRGHPRHVVSSEPRGELCLFEIVSVLWLHRPELSVLSKEEHREGELLGVSLPDQDAWMPTKVLSSAPLRAGDSLRHRVRLCIAGTDWASETQPTSKMREWHTTTDTAVNAVWCH